MYYRRKVILSLLKAFGGKLGHRDFQKLLFLYTQHQRKPSFSFFPYKYGGFSAQAHYDCGALANKGYLSNGDGWRLETKKDFVGQLEDSDRKALIALYSEWKDVRGVELLRHVYEAYPYFATKSEIAARVLDAASLSKVEEARPTVSKSCLFTIGYEGRSIDEYVNLLVSHDVRLLCDVRKNAVSRKFGFSKNRLRSSVEKVDIAYHHVPELGIASGKRKALNSKDAYLELFEQYERETLPNRQDELDDLLSLVSEHQRVALTCYERDCEQCHRSRVSRALSQLPRWNHVVKHL